MLLKLDGNFAIEDLWNHTPESVEQLQKLLANGVPAFPDAHRKDFFEIEHEFEVFYVHICPNGKVLLLAIWPKGSVQAHVQAANHFTAASAL